MTAYLERDNVQARPLALDEARRLIASGEYGETDRGWIDGMPQWRNIADIAELATALPVYVSPPQTQLQSLSQATPYATFWRRSASLLTDSMLLVSVAIAGRIGLGALGLFGFGSISSNEPLTQLIEQALNFIGAPASMLGFILVAGYFAIWHASPMQATPGKVLFGCIVVNQTGGPLSGKQVVFRELLRMLTAIPIGLTYWAQIFTSKRQTLHDLLVGSIVIRRTEQAGLPSGGILFVHMLFVLFLVIASVLSLA